MSKDYDVLVIGAGAAGMMCAARAGAGGLRVLLIDHAAKLAEKIRISGGGRCNFTNLHAHWERYLSENPRFCRYALNQYGPQDFLSLVEAHGIGWHEKHRGQLFCNDSSQQIIDMLQTECRRAGVRWLMPAVIETIAQQDGGFVVKVQRHGTLSARKLVIATGGMALPAIGASAFGLEAARQFGHDIIPTAPALVPLNFDPAQWSAFAGLSGVSMHAEISAVHGRSRQSFEEDILLTHRGLSGPGILQISSYWDGKHPIELGLVPAELEELLLKRKQRHPKQHLGTVLNDYLPKRLAQTWMSTFFEALPPTLAEISNKSLREIAQSLRRWQLLPSGTAGYKKAEVMRGGVNTRELDPKTMASRKVAGLYFIGEVVDITGWLGGYNFQWAWSSAVVCAQALCADLNGAARDAAAFRQLGGPFGRVRSAARGRSG